MVAAILYAGQNGTSKSTTERVYYKHNILTAQQIIPCLYIHDIQDIQDKLRGPGLGPGAAQEVTKCQNVKCDAKIKNRIITRY